jgi:hypothetical protein
MLLRFVSARLRQPPDITQTLRYSESRPSIKNQWGNQKERTIPIAHSVSNPWLSNFSVRLFSVTVRTSWSVAPLGSRASISIVTVISAPI